MAASIASYVKRIIDRSPFLSDMLIQDIASYSNLALSIKPKVEELYGSSVSTSSIVMAIRRYADELRAKPRGKRSEDIGYEIQMKTNIYDVNLRRNDLFAEKLPDKWNTNIGENGCELSGGERQRISIARAFLKNAPVILLDEATASLDVENETLIQTALSRLIKDKTVLVIAHRMRTVAGADKIVVLSDGMVAEEGDPDTLLRQDGIYTRMVKLQTESQNWTLA